MTNSSYLVRREIYQNKNAARVEKTSDELPSENRDTDDVKDRSGMNEKRQQGDIPGVANTENKNK